MCGENVVLCRTGRVKKCGEKINEEEEVSSLRLRASKKERALLIFRSRKQVLELHSPPEKRRKERREIFQSLMKT
jgi:hypothetical protein